MEPAGNKKILVDEIVMLEAEMLLLEEKDSRHRVRRGKLASLAGKVFLYMFFGRNLTHDLGNLIVAVGTGKEPFFGRAMARALDAASMKLIGYKRWLLGFGALAALPGVISVVLLWQQNLAVADETARTVADTTNSERLDLLRMIYLTYDKTPFGSLSTPMHSAANRRRATLLLIERDAAELARTEEDDLLKLNRMVDVSRAPLGGVDFSPLPGENRKFRHVGFVNSNFDHASFARCEFEHVWFSEALLWHTDFRGAVCRDTAFDGANLIGVDFRQTKLIDCDFTGAVFDPTTQWPEGYDFRAAGARPYEETQSPGN